jgi:PAS domain S-box-containing protein
MPASETRASPPGTRPSSQAAASLDQQAPGTGAGHDAEQRLRWIVESAPVCLARVARDGTILAMNTAARAMMGASRANDVLRKSFFSFVADDDRGPSQRFVDQACTNQAGSLELRLSSIAGIVRTVEARAIALPPAANAEPTAFLVLLDVTTRRRLER